MTTQSDARFRAMLEEAKDRVLFVSPPYTSQGKGRAFLAGYETALRDIATGKLQPRHPDFDIYGRHLREVARDGRHG